MNETVLLFEDKKQTAEKICQSLSAALRGIADIRHFAPLLPPDTEKPFDERLTNEIAARQKNGERIAFVVSDADLTATESFNGLSEANVRKTVNRLGIPAAFYSNNFGLEEYLRANQAGDGRILLNLQHMETMTEEVKALVQGFATIRTKLSKLTEFSADDRPSNTAALLSYFLSRPEIEYRINLYVSGDQRMAAELLTTESQYQFDRQCALYGTWIYDSLLKYPGLVVNRTAAASYLNIDENAFSEAAIQELFSKAAYEGPFCLRSQPLWWRDKLDDLVGEYDSGREYAANRLKKSIAPCMCSEDSSLEAGYYCMVTRKPVSYEKSVGEVSWFPPGADLSRICVSKHEELAPWLGL